jgi:eukaryotic-like serine/threonine-protein kinase
MTLYFTMGTVFGGKYELVRELGRGGMGAVIRAKRLSDGVHVALKVCHVVGDPDTTRRFQREVRIMQSIDHPHVVKILDADLTDTTPYFVMPLAQNTLDDELTQFSTDVDAALDAFQQVCLGVQAIHQARAVHRDIKPANCLRSEDDSVAVSDMGLARFEVRDTTTLTSTNVSIGTVHFMAPEQFRPGGSRDADFRTDVCQLGKTLYCMLTGASPLLMDMSAIPQGIRHIIARATRTDPIDRYQTVAELMDAIDVYRRSQLPSANPRALFDTCLNQLKPLIAIGQFDIDQTRKLLETLDHIWQADGVAGLTAFDEIPDTLWPIISARLPNELLTILRHYVPKIEVDGGSFGFSYAEVVARKMRAIFETTTNADIRTMALEATLMAAAINHRFAAMEVFNRMLRAVTPGEDLPVSEMLNRQIVHYRDLADQIPAMELHPAIRAVRMAATTLAAP